MSKAQTILSVPLVFLALVFQGGCRLLGPGYIGPIQSPALDIPGVVGDLRALEYGDQIIVAFTIPRLTTEGLELTSLRSVDLYAGPNGPAATDANAWFRTATHYTVPASGPGPLEHHIPAQAWAGKEVVLRVRATGPKGKVSQWSGPFVLNVITPLPRPADLKAVSQKNGVHLSWQGTAPMYRVLRAVPDGMPEKLADTDKPDYLDDSAQFGMRYQYMVLAFANENQQSVVSEPFTLPTLVDTFPPDVPVGVNAVAGVNTIELEWERNTETDFKGYNIFRSVDGGPFERVASAIEAPTYSDTNVQAGKMYRYAISSVDVAGNESARSEPVPAAL